MVNYSRAALGADYQTVVQGRFLEGDILESLNVIKVIDADPIVPQDHQLNPSLVPYFCVLARFELFDEPFSLGLPVEVKIEIELLLIVGNVNTAG